MIHRIRARREDRGREEEGAGRGGREGRACLLNNIMGASSQRTSTQTSRRVTWWHGWAISITIFAFTITCATPPPADVVSTSNASSGNNLQSSSATVGASKREDGAANVKVQVQAGDVLVQCELITPFDESSAKGTLHITVHQSAAPLASNAFLDMVKAGHFDYNYTFRSVEGFIVQWGIESSKPAGEGAKGRAKFPKVDIDPPPAKNVNTLRSNVRGALNFAGGNSGSGQVYVNRRNNKYLDKEPGSLPFATLGEESMAIIDAVYSYKEGSGQVKAVKKGDDEVKSLFPKMGRIEKCWIDDGSS